MGIDTSVPGPFIAGARLRTLDGQPPAVIVTGTAIVTSNDPIQGDSATVMADLTPKQALSLAASLRVAADLAL